MSSLERLIVQNINHNKLKESIYPSNDYETDIDRQTEDLVEIYNLMLDKGYDNLPESTCEKRSYREIEAKLIELNVDGVRKSPIISSKAMPGEFLSTQEKTMLPESKRLQEFENDKDLLKYIRKSGNKYYIVHKGSSIGMSPYTSLDKAIEVLKSYKKDKRYMFR